MVDIVEFACWNRKCDDSCLSGDLGVPLADVVQEMREDWMQRGSDGCCTDNRRVGLPVHGLGMGRGPLVGAIVPGGSLERYPERPHSRVRPRSREDPRIRTGGRI